ncbi:hypothetical protein GFB49_00250 [Epibacterium sp. SM1979]|uniref:ABM domain-containing protein n=1 Tax=Tritonibacter litoralis TaxID=2662264 RepID=A0A843YB41_9RHOB|nr:antibiotic biosynthesis monooxygenase [Tritonibacter litoralis]MQQ06875.1 hypothetical protein [Tritonibacter litoralis]
MTEAIIVTLVPSEECFDDLLNLLSSVLPETRAFEGCKMAEVYHNRSLNEIALVQMWQDSEAHDDYLDWRAQSGVFDKVAELIAEEQIHRSFQVV